MLVSVIMGIYNMKDVELAKKSIDSLFNQTYENLEIIVCNDGSTNKEYSEIEKYLKEDNRVEIITNKKNMGLAYSLNRTIEKSNGKYIARMDIDDTMELNRIEKQVRYLNKKKEYDFVGTNAKLVNCEGEWGRVCVPIKPGKKDFYKNSPFIHASIMIRRNALIDVGGYRVNKETRRAEDYDLWMRLYSKSYKGVNIQEPLYNITENKMSYSRRKYMYRIDEAIVRYKGYKELDILFPFGYIYVLKPLLVGLLPADLMIKIRGRRDKI